MKSKYNIAGEMLMYISQLLFPPVFCLLQTQLLEDSDMEEGDGGEEKEDLKGKGDQHLRRDIGQGFLSQSTAYEGSDGGCDKENNFSKVCCPAKLVLDKGCGQMASSAVPVYKLSAAILHRGLTPYSGHYVASVRCKAQEWFLFNDENVNPTSLDRVLTDVAQDGYVLFFETKH